MYILTSLFRKVFIISISFLLLSDLMSFAQTSQNFKLRNYVIDQNGQRAHSAKFKLIEATGQATAIGSSQSQMVIIAGFLAQARALITVINDNPDLLPMTYFLNQNYPNPFNPSTTIEYGIPRAGKVSIKIWNILGQLVAEPVNQFYEAGSYKIIFDASNLVSGLYFYQIQADEFRAILRMLLIK